MAIIARDHGLLFIMVPHTGSSAVGRALIEQCGGSWLPEKPERDAKGEIVLPRKHNTVSQLISHGVITRDERKSLVTAGTHAETRSTGWCRSTCACCPSGRVTAPVS